jgi:chromosome partitioning protein
VLLDCPPSLGLLTLNALTAAQEVYIPLQTEFLALQGVSKLIDTMNVVKKRLNPSLTITGIIGTMYDGRKNLNREVVEKIREYFADKLFETLIHDNVALAEAPSYGQTIFEYIPTAAALRTTLPSAKRLSRGGRPWPINHAWDPIRFRRRTLWVGSGATRPKRRPMAVANRAH